VANFRSLPSANKFPAVSMVDELANIISDK
jgi:hypothetical protein